MNPIEVEIEREGLIHDPLPPLWAGALRDLTQGRRPGRVGAGHHEARGQQGRGDQMVAAKAKRRFEK